MAVILKSGIEKRHRIDPIIYLALQCCLHSLSLSVSQVVFSSCELGVFDALLGAERPLSAEEISRAIGASLDGTERLLAACAGLQLLNAHQQDTQGQLHYRVHTLCCLCPLCPSQ